jgi:hypothetical protein
MFPTDVVIVAGARTPMARYTGAACGIEGRAESGNARGDGESFVRLGN